MAVWQFDLHLLPAAGVLRQYGAMPIVIPESDFDQVSWWNGLTRLHDLETEISRLLPRLQSWSVDLKQWGSDAGDRIDLWRDGDKIESVSVRVDVRSLSNAFFANMLALSRNSGYLLRISEGRVFQPKFARLLSAIKESDAFRFVENPRHFLESLEEARKAEAKDEDAIN